MKDKVLISIVTRNNAALIEHLCESLERHPAGYAADTVILDASSDNLKHLNALDKLSKRYTIQKVPNNRVEANYNISWSNNKDYKYYFFMHDDSYVLKDNWLGLFIERLNSEYSEKEITNHPYANFPIGKVCVGTQFWRNYENVLGYPVQCIFLKYVLDIIRPNGVPDIFKYCDGDRVLVTNECMVSTNGFRHVGEFKSLKENNTNTYNELCKVLHKHLPYVDEGCYPKSLYPHGECWNKLCLTSEFLNSIDPLVAGYRSVGLEDDGYLEQIHGFETPFQHNCITHYGSPNFRQFIGKSLNSDMETIKTHFGEKCFILKMDKIYKEWQKNNASKI